MLAIGALFIFLAVATMLFALGLVGNSEKVVVRRLDVPRPSRDAADDADAPDLIREDRSGILKFVASATAVSRLQRNLMLAGYPEGWTLTKLLALKPVLTGLGVLVFVMLARNGLSRTEWLMGLGAIGYGYFAPDLIIKNRAKVRQEALQKELPDVLDQVTISIEAGLGFEAAFARIGERRTGPLADEIVRTVQDMRLGMGRRDAYQAWADRCDVEDIRSFVKAVQQAEAYGVSITSVVRNQAGEMRYKRRARAEAAASKVPVKIIFPLLTCIFPVLFIITLTPALLTMAEQFAQQGG